MRVLYVEPFERGSHASFTQVLTQAGALPGVEWTVLTLPGRHWKWRMRGVVAWAALEQGERLAAPYDLVLASSYVPLAELVGLAPALASVPRILYFHENQLTFPRRGPDPGERDHHFGFTQLVSALAATRCVFNSAHNRDGFLEAGRELLGRMPDAVPRGWVERIEARSEVLPVPVALPDEAPAPDAEPEEPVRALGPVILWNHRWEHDKGPEGFFDALEQLCAREVPFRVAVCGQRFSRVPDVFERARAWLGDRVVQWGTCESGAEYHALLGRAHLAVSTAEHEFFGISMVEATHFGAAPLVPDRLAYPEIFPSKHRYPDHAALVDRLEARCRAWVSGAVLREDRRALTDPYRAVNLLPRYLGLLQRVVRDVVTGDLDDVWVRVSNENSDEDTPPHCCVYSTSLGATFQDSECVTMSDTETTESLHFSLSNFTEYDHGHYTVTCELGLEDTIISYRTRET